MNMPKVEPIQMDTKGKPLWYRITHGFQRRQWKLIEDFIFDISFTKNLKITSIVPKGFIFDFASVPRPFWPILDPVGLLLVGSLFHDFGYRYGGLFLYHVPYTKWIFKSLHRFELDRMFELTNDDVNDMKIMSKIARFAVNIGGFLVWKKNRKNNLDVFNDYPQFL